MSIEQQAGLPHVYMQAQQIQIAADAASLVLRKRRWRRLQRRRMIWVRPWLEAARRFQHCHFHRQMPELRLDDYLENVQMSETSFLFCLQAVSAVPERRGSAVRTPWKRTAYTKSAAQAQ